MNKVLSGLLLVMVVCGWSARSKAATSDAALSGTVRDVHGAPQMGALVQLLRADSFTVATAMSDDHGRYIMPTVQPGRYELKATAAFFVPVLRGNVRLHAGAQAIVDLTMSAMFEADNWLPAQRRRADEPADDWKWALRSSANRPLLRWIDPETGTAFSSSAAIEEMKRVASQGRVFLTSGDGSFGDGGMHQAVVLNHTTGDGGGAVLRAEVGDPQSIGSVGPSVSLTAGYERQTLGGGSTRMVTSFQSHPELTSGTVPGFEVLQMATTQRIALGDVVSIDAGTLLLAERLAATRIESLPYVRVSLRPADDLVVEVRFATGRALQSTDDLDKLKPEVSVLTDSMGRPLSVRGLHEELSVSRRLGDRVLSASVFHDRLDRTGLAGGGGLTQAMLQPGGLVADPTTGTFELAGGSYTGDGVSVSFLQPLTPALSAWVQYDLGTAMQAGSAVAGAPALADVATSLRAARSQAASFALRGKVLRTGTSLKAEYRWQPQSTVTQVDPYNVQQDEAYLSFYVRQRLWCGRFLPQGVDAVVEATNLLQQGYRPVLAADGHSLYLAQVPQAVQGGLAFNF